GRNATGWSSISMSCTKWSMGSGRGTTSRTAHRTLHRAPKATAHRCRQRNPAEPQRLDAIGSSALQLHGERPPSPDAKNSLPARTISHFTGPTNDTTPRAPPWKLQGSIRFRRGLMRAAIHMPSVDAAPRGEERANARRPTQAASMRELFTRLGREQSGRPEEKAGCRPPRVAPNRLERARPVSPIKVLIDQVRSVVVALLVAAAASAIVMGEPVEAGAIVAVLAINRLTGLVTEVRARRAMAALGGLDVPRAFVVRHGDLRAVDTYALVPGDVIEINAGQHVPADGRVLDEWDLRTDEATLTGESLPVSKSAAVLPTDTPLAERTNMVYKGTTVAAGTARVLVTATGPATELGRIGALVGGLRDEPTPLERRLDELGRRLV